MAWTGRPIHPRNTFNSVGATQSGPAGSASAAIASSNSSKYVRSPYISLGVRNSIAEFLPFYDLWPQL